MTSRVSLRALLVCTMAALLASAVGAIPAAAQASTPREVPGMRMLYGIWCGSDGVCLAVGDADTGERLGGVAVVRANGAMGPVTPVRGTWSLTQIDCAPDGGCIAIGRGPAGGVVVEVSRDGTPVAVRPVPGTTGLSDVACPTATTCVATAGFVTWSAEFERPFSVALFVVITNGQPGPPQLMPRGAAAWTIDCLTATRCLAIGSGVVVVVTNVDGTWTAALRRFSGSSATGWLGDDISCASSTTCYATAIGSVPVGTGYYTVPGIVPVSADGTVGPVQLLIDELGNSRGISCAFGRTCTVIGSSNVLPGAEITIDVFRGTPTPPTRWPVFRFTGISCIAAATCGIVGNMYQAPPVFLWHGPVPA
ncbi:MAG TPA: hypothetical protein VG078_04855 [Acidimicrobiales bacterium]|nr:hypothetical protein [Acidimicrobiales bacterium]